MKNNRDTFTFLILILVILMSIGIPRTLIKLRQLSGANYVTQLCKGGQATTKLCGNAQTKYNVEYLCDKTNTECWTEVK